MATTPKTKTPAAPPSKLARHDDDVYEGLPADLDEEPTPAPKAAPPPEPPSAAPQPPQELPEPPPPTRAEAKAGKALYRVWEHGKLRRDGKTYKPGDTLVLSPEEAAKIPCLLPVK